MVRLIPGKTKVQIELFKGVTLADIFVVAVAMIALVFVLISSLPWKLVICIVLGLLTVLIVSRINGEPNYVYILHILRHFVYPRCFRRTADYGLLTKEEAETDSEEKFNAFFSEEEEEQKRESKKERKARMKAEKARKKREDKMLKSRKVSEEEKEAIREQRDASFEKSAKAMAQAREEQVKYHSMQDIIAFTDIRDGFIEYGTKYYGSVIEIPPVEFRFFSESRRKMTIEGALGRVLRSINPDFSANIVKLERPIIYENFIDAEYGKLEALKRAYENGMFKEDELQTRVEVLYDRIYALQNLSSQQKVVAPFYYLVLFDSDKRQLSVQVSNALNSLRTGEMDPHLLDTKELAVFLKYSNQLDFDESEIDNIEPDDYAVWAMPDSVDMKPRTVEVNHIITHTFRVVNYPTTVGDAWLAGVMSMPGTKVVVKCSPMDRMRAIRGIDRSLGELRGQYMATGTDSKLLELQTHIETLSDLLATMQMDNESLLNVNVYITAYDIAATRENVMMLQPEESFLPNISNMKKNVRRAYQENGFRLNNLEFDQVQAFIASQVSGYDPMEDGGRGIPSNSLAASYPWIYSNLSDEGGIHMGSTDGIPVFVDFFKRDSERVNSNMVIVGKSGSGKSYATKMLLSNLAAEDAKIFVLDPENEYTELAQNLHGKFINVGNALFGRLNPFQIITALDDDEADGESVSGSYSTHLQFLEEFFRQILPDCDKDAMEYLNSLVDRVYINNGITPETNLSLLEPEDYPTFDSLYDAILLEFQQTDNAYIRSILRILMNYVAKFSTGGRNANIWNGPSTVTTEENFTVFNFQSLLANRNPTIANAQMLLVLKYIDNEIIKNRDYNTKYGLHRKVVVVIDEAHVFIDTKFPVALDFMFQLAKRIRKYNGMQIVITQNIKDFVGSEEIARKSTAIINACQYSLIFTLAPNDITDLCTLYEKAGGINENEQEQITSAPKGQAFTVMSPTSRTTFQVEAPEDVVELFSQPDYISRYFSGEEGAQVWEDFISESREVRRENGVDDFKTRMEKDREEAPVKQRVFFEEVEEEDEEEQTAGTGSVGGITFEEVEEEPFEEELFEMDPDIKALADAQALKNAATVPPIVIQQQANSETEKLLTDLLGRFAHDAMVEEIRRSVREETEALLGAVPTAVAPTVSTAVAPTVSTAVAPTVSTAVAPTVSTAPIKPIEPSVPIEPASPAMPVTEAPAAASVAPAEIPIDVPAPEEGANLGSVFDGVTTEAEVPSAEAVNEPEKEDLPDIMALIAQQAEKIGSVSPIEQMEYFGEQVLTVTLEELATFNRKKRENAAIHRSADEWST